MILKGDVIPSTGGLVAGSDEVVVSAKRTESKGGELLHAGDFYFTKEELFEWGVADTDVNNWILSNAPIALQKEYFRYARDHDLGEAAGPVAFTLVAPLALIGGAEIGAGASAIRFLRYPRAGGVGVDFGKFRLDWHRIRLGGRKTGKDYNLPHIDIPGKIKHWPWHQINKWWRGVK